MTVTAVSEFKKLLPRIPKETYKQVWFFPVRQNQKNPEVPGGTTLKGNLAYRLQVKDCLKRLKSGRNVGIYALTGGLMFLDLDVENGKLKASGDFLFGLVPSFCVRTRNGGYQYYYLNDGHYANQVIIENGKEIGELRTDWYYVVSVGSYVIPDDNGNGDGTYRVIDDYPIVPFSGLEDYISRRENKKEDITPFTKTSDGVIGDIKGFKKKLKSTGKKQKRLTQEEINRLLEKLRSGKPCRLKTTNR